jgi:hypothetical protein
MTMGVAVVGVLAIAPSRSHANPEVMTDRCSGEVAFTTTFDGKPTDKGTIILKRKDGASPLTTINVQPSGGGHIRWWCHSTIGNVFDPGTWRIQVDGSALTACLISVGEVVAADGASADDAGASTGDAGAKCLKSVKLSSSAFQGWTPERSRCNNHSGHLKARLGPHRLLQTVCL